MFNKYNARYNRDVRLMDSGVKALQDYTWPGNVRQLQHVIERLTHTGRTACDSDSVHECPDTHGVAREARETLGRR